MSDSYDFIQPNISITWLLPSLNINSAGIRLRCLHFARKIDENGIKCRLYVNIKKATDNLKISNILIITKKLDLDILNIVSAAREAQKPIILDLCDDLCHPEYKSNINSINKYILEFLSAHVSLITVPSAAMKERMESYLEKCNCKPRVSVIPDPIESPSDVEETYKFLRKKYSPEDIGAKPELQDYSSNAGNCNSREKRLLWFGADGSNSNFGISSIIPILNTIKKLQNKCAFQLVVVSNEGLSIDLIKNYGICVEFIPWSFDTIYRELSKARASLLTTGDDDLCLTKSNNRLLLSLSQNCPVIAINYPNSEEFRDVICRNVNTGVEKYFIDPNWVANSKRDVAFATDILKRYDLSLVANTLSECVLDCYFSSSASASQIHFRTTVLCITDCMPVADLKSVKKYALDHSFKIKFAFFGNQISEDVLDWFNAENIYPYKLSYNSNINLSTIKAIFISNQLELEGKKYIEKCVSAYPEIKKYNSSESLPFFIKSGEDLAFIESPFFELPENIPGRFSPINLNCNNNREIEWLFIVPIEARNWILDAIAKEIGSRHCKSWSIFYSPKSPTPYPKARNVFFMHQSLLMRYKKLLSNEFIYTWYTHPGNDEDKNIPSHLEAFQKCHKVVFACSRFMKLWNQSGLSPDKTTCILGGADEKMFTAHKRIGRVVGLSSSFYERKNPDLLFEITRMMPDVSFRLIGKGWENYARFEEMLRFGNLEYIQAKYHEYPRYYQDVNVFLSTAKLEGGPIPLIEAMMANCLPVASDTGFCPDIIKHGKNGFLFPADNPSVSEVCNLIERGFELSHVNIRDTVLDYTWDKFSSSITDLAKK